jgi:hypothetical protein
MPISPTRIRTSGRGDALSIVHRVVVRKGFALHGECSIPRDTRDQDIWREKPLNAYRSTLPMSVREGIHPGLAFSIALLQVM